MFGGYDPSYNPEALEKAKAESKELDPQQQEMADKWAATMASNGVETAVAQAAAETVATETEPTIPETEPVLQAQAEENMTQAQIDMANAEAEVAAAQAEADDAVMNGEDPEEYEEVEEDYIDQNGKPAKRKVRRPKISNKQFKPGTPVQGMGAEETLQTMAAASPAGAVIAEAVDQALEYAKQGINDIDVPGADGGPKEDGKDDKDGLEATPNNQEGEEAPMTPETPEVSEAPAGIQHFPQGEATSSFNPLTPEEQLAQQQAAEADAAQRYDGDNLVAQAVSDGSGEGTIDLNSVGGKLEGEGVGIQGEVDKMKADTAKDIAMAGGNQTEATIDPAQTVDNLTVDAGAEALALKEQAADVKAAVENGDADADSKVAEFTQAAAETEQLASIAESASIEAGEQISETVGEARNMTEEAKDAVNQAQTEAAVTEEERKDEEEGEGEGENSTFNSDKYPELAGLDNGDRKSIFM